MSAAAVSVEHRHGVPAPPQAKNLASAAVAGMSLWHAEEPEGGTNPRGSIAENAHAPVPPPRPRRALRRHSPTGRAAAPRFLDTPAPAGRGTVADGDARNSCHALPGPTAGGGAAGTRRRSVAARARGEESVARSRASRRRGSRRRRRAGEESAIS